MAQNSVDDIVMCVSLFTSVTKNIWYVPREQLINVMSDYKFLDTFCVPRHFGQFWTAFLVSTGLRIGQDLGYVQI